MARNETTKHYTKLAYSLKHIGYNILNIVPIKHYTKWNNIKYS